MIRIGLRSRGRGCGDFARPAGATEGSIDGRCCVVKSELAYTVGFMARPVGHSRTIGVSRSGGCFTMSFSRERKTAKRRICLPLGFFRWIPLMSTIIIGWSSEKPFWARTVGSMPSTLNDLLVIEGVTGGLAAFVEELKERGDEFVLGNRYLRFFWRKTGYDTRLLSVHRSTINFGMRTGFLPHCAASVRLPASIWINTNTMLCCL